MHSKGTITPGLKHVCTIKADVSGLTNSMDVCEGSNGQYYAVEFHVAISLPVGGAQLQARLQWEEDVSRVVYDSVG